MKTVYIPIDQRPPAPSFVSEARRHLKAADALDGSMLDNNPADGSVLVEQGDLRIALTRDEGKLEKFYWVKGDDQYGDSETYSIDRVGEQETYTQISTRPDDFNTIRSQTQSAGISLTDGGLLFQESYTEYREAY